MTATRHTCAPPILRGRNGTAEKGGGGDAHIHLIKICRSDNRSCQCAKTLKKMSQTSISYDPGLGQAQPVQADVLHDACRAAGGSDAKCDLVKEAFMDGQATRDMSERYKVTLTMANCMRTQCDPQTVGPNNCVSKCNDADIQARQYPTSNTYASYSNATAMIGGAARVPGANLTGQSPYAAGVN